MKEPAIWIIPAFLGGGVYVACEPDDPLCTLKDANGVSWKPRKRRALVQPDNPDDRGLPTILWRETPGQLPAPTPAETEPAPPAPLALPAPARFDQPYSQEDKELCLRLIALDAPEVPAHHY